MYKSSGGGDGEGEGRQCPVQSQSNCDGRGGVIVAGFPRNAAQHNSVGTFTTARPRRSRSAHGSLVTRSLSC